MMMAFMKVSGQPTTDTDLVSKFGQKEGNLMRIGMKENGQMIKEMVLENKSSKVVTSTKEIGKMEIQKEWEKTLTQMVVIMKDSGVKMLNLARDTNSTQVVKHTKENGPMM